MANDIVLQESVQSPFSVPCSAIAEMTNLCFDEIARFYPSHFGEDPVCEEWCLGSKEVFPLLLLGASKGMHTNAYSTLAELLDNQGIDISRYTLSEIRAAGEEKLQERHYAWESLRKEQKKTLRSHAENDFESSLVSFLSSKGIRFERQINHGKSRFDILIPGELIIEVKAGKVNGDDACQALDYLAFSQLDVLLVGSGLSNSATRAIEAANKISKDNKILFVTKSACFPYLRDVL
jgi:hypothetical protein